MRILHTVESYLPAMHGMQKVVQQISEKLSLLGHEVIIATKYASDRELSIINGVAIESFKLSGNSVEGIEGSESEKIRYVNFVKEGNFDIVANFAAQQWATDLLLPHLDEIDCKKVFIPTGFSKLNDIGYQEYYNQMIAWLKAYDMNVFLSADYQDINFAKENEIKNIAVIANAASSEEFYGLSEGTFREMLNIRSDEFLILTVGSHTGLKGHKEAIEIFRHSRLENATLLIIGNHATSDSFVKTVFINMIKMVLNIFSFITKKKYVASCYHSCRIKSKFYNFLFKIISKQKKIIVVSFNRQDTLKAYSSADLFLFPSNIECSPLVLFEAIAAKTPFLSSSAGNAVEIAAVTKGGVILPTIKNKDGYSKVDVDESVKMLEALYSSNETRAELANNGYNSWMKYYTWETITKQYESLYLTLLSK